MTGARKGVSKRKQNGFGNSRRHAEIAYKHIPQRKELTVDICDFIEDANEAFLFNVTLDHEMFADQVQLRRCLPYKANKEIDMMIIALASIQEEARSHP